MNKEVGVRFKQNGKIYDFDPQELELKTGDYVVVDTERGLGFATIITEPSIRSEDKPKRELKKVIRLASEQDIEQKKRCEILENEAFEYCWKQIKILDLKMNLFTVENTFDGTKLTFYFTADGRIDFRELVKILVRYYRIKIEMRQVGIRHQAKMWGGVGRCGREICCTGFLQKFDPISIRMAKEQNLSLNPTKISGICGRLMCCLTYEYDTYKKLKVNFPKVGTIVKTAKGNAKVIRLNVINNKLTVKYDTDNELEILLDEVLDRESFLNQAYVEPEIDDKEDKEAIYENDLNEKVVYKKETNEKVFFGKEEVEAEERFNDLGKSQRPRRSQARGK